MDSVKNILSDINNENKNNDKPMSKEEQDNLKLKFLNNSIGNLGYYNCDKCKNKGIIYYFYEDTIFKTRVIKTKHCDCVKIRNVYKNLEKCGINQRLLEKYSLDNFETKEDWQAKLKSKCINYIEQLKENKDFRNWFVISGISGSGKTMVCTAIFKELIMQGYNGKYFLWKDEIVKLKQLKKSSYTDNIELYEELMKELKTIDVLYVDDFLKLTDSKEKENDLNLAYEIINSRYINDKITIISTEYTKEELLNFDMATTGRIIEKSKGNYIQLAYDKNRNYRLKEEK